MHEDRPAFGQRLAELAERGVIECRPELLDAGECLILFILYANALLSVTQIAALLPVLQDAP